MNLKALFATTAMLLSPCVTLAGPYTDDLSKCLIESTTQDDRVALAKWMFVAFSAHPAVAPISAVKPADVEAANKEIGTMFMRLLTESCRDVTKKAVTFEGGAAVQQSFKVLGEAAGGELAQNPAVQARLVGVAKYFDGNKLAALAKDSNSAPK